jgi:hypothetical protein
MSNYPAENVRWKQARRSAFVQDVLTTFTQRPADLHQFEEVRHKLQLGQADDVGLQEVPLDHIVGSVGRYQDFTRAFFPRRDDLQERWQRIDRLVAAGGRLPPIELYKVGQVYFVSDGNHRVSVARQRQLPTIRAYVWEYKTPLPLQPDTDIDALLCQTARAAFLERTGLDRLCPDLHIELTQPDAYAELLGEIEAYQHILSDIDRRAMPFDEAVALWCEMRYTPIVDIIRRRDALREFPGRTEADLYLWLCRNQADLQADYEQHVLMEEAADDLGRRFSNKFLPLRYTQRAARWIATTGMNWAGGWRRAARRALRRG